MTSESQSPVTASPPPSDQGSEVRRKKWFFQWGMPVFTLLFLVTGWIFVRYFYDTIYGVAVVNLMTVVVVGLSVISLLIWFCVLSYFSRKAVLSVMLLLLLTAVGWAACIRDVQFAGDMYLDFVYRWEPKPVPQQTARAEANADIDRTFSISPTDMPAYRGANRDGIVEGPPLATDWDAHSPKELWRTDVGGGYASMAVVGDRLFTLEQREQEEAVTCYDAATGELVWIHQYSARFYEAMGGLGPRTTPTIHEGKVYSFGATGYMTCLDFFTGEEIWSRDLLQELQAPNVTWGMSASPLIIENKVIVNPGAPNGDGLMALDLSSGETIWQSAGLTTYNSEENNRNFSGYASPDVVTLAGIPQILIFNGKGLSSHDIETGERLWHFDFENDAGVNVAQPILLDNGNQILLSASYALGSTLIEVNHKPEAEDKQSAWDVKQIWQEKRILRAKFSNSIYHNGFVYGLDEGIMMCIDPQTGKRQWKNGRYGHGQLLLSNDLIVVLAEDGTLNLVKADPAEFNEVARTMVLPDASKVWNPPALVDGIIYVRDHTEMAAYQLNQ